MLYDGCGLFALLIVLSALAGMFVGGLLDSYGAGWIFGAFTFLVFGLVLKYGIPR